MKVKLGTQVPDNNKYKKQIENNLNLLARRLKSVRKELNLTLNDVHKATGLTLNKISNYENARKIPRVDTLLTLATHYDVSVDWLIGLKNKK